MSPQNKAQIELPGFFGNDVIYGGRLFRGFSVFHKPEQLLGALEPEFARPGRRTELMLAKRSRRSFIGIDVSKQLLEIGVHKSKYRLCCPNDPKKFPALIAELIALRPARIVLEATGGFEKPLLQGFLALVLPGGP